MHVYLLPILGGKTGPMTESAQKESGGKVGAERVAA